jgi:hypothetical protein
MDHEKFMRLTWYEWSLYINGYLNQNDERLEEMGIMMAHIANCTAPKKHGQWSREDFIKLIGDTSVPERKLTMKEAKKLLGSTWKLPPHAK